MMTLASSPAPCRSWTGAAAAYLLREKHQEAGAAVQNIEDQLEALDPATRAAVVARLTSDEVKKVHGNQP